MLEEYETHQSPFSLDLDLNKIRQGNHVIIVMSSSAEKLRFEVFFHTY